MGAEDTPAWLPLDVATVPIDSTSAPAYDGEVRIPWPYGTPTQFREVRHVFGIDFDATDTNVDVVLRNFTAGSNVVSTDSITSDTDLSFETFSPSDVDGNDQLGLRVNVDTASGTAGAEATVVSRLLLLP